MTVSRTETIIIKIGSARVSAETHQVNDFLFDLIADIRELKEKGKQIIIVSSGAIAQGKKLLKENFQMEKDSSSLPVKQALAAMGQNRLMNLYASFFHHANLSIAQILFGKRDLQEESGILNLKNTFQELLSWGVIPIVNENDSVSTEELNLGDNDTLAGLLAALLEANHLVIVTSVDGFFVQGKKIDTIQEFKDEWEKEALGPSGPGRGGMITKVRTARKLAELGISTSIINGATSRPLRRLFSERNFGTTFLPRTPLTVQPAIQDYASLFFAEESP